MTLPSAYQLNYFVPVAGLNQGGQPLGPGEYLQVALNGDSIGRKAEVGHQAGNTEAFRDFASFPVHNDSDRRVHRATGVVDFPPSFALTWNRNSV